MNASRGVVGAAVTVVLAGASLASSAPASAVLVLKSRGHVAPPGTPVLGTLRFGPCGAFTSSGTLAVNNASVDQAGFTATTGGGGGCGEGGPIITGTVSADKLTETGLFVVVAKLRYTTTLSGDCPYSLNRLAGRFTIPGRTQAFVSGVGRLVAGSNPECPGTTRVTGAEAKLYDASTNELFEAEP